MRNQYDSSIPNNASASSVADVSSEATSSTWLTATEAARYLKIKTRTILFWARSGRIKAYSLTGYKRRVWRFRQCDLDAALFASAVLTSSSSSAGSADRRQ
jgi:excisionase family DNA binding protein